MTAVSPRGESTATKICRRCKRTLPLESFYASKRDKDGDGRSRWCRECYEERPRS